MSNHSGDPQGEGEGLLRERDGSKIPKPKTVSSHSGDPQAGGVSGGKGLVQDPDTKDNE